MWVNARKIPSPVGQFKKMTEITLPLGVGRGGSTISV